MSLLRAEGLGVRYGGVHANLDIDLEVAAGELVGLIGPNGAGKTTLLDALTGFVSPSSGCVVFDGRDLARVTPSERAHLGLVRTFQSLELFEDLTVADNLRVAAQPASWRGVLADLFRPLRPSSVDDAVAEALAGVGLQAQADLLPTELSHGHRMLVAIARALAARPRVVLLDEPGAGLDVDESQQLGSRLRGLVDAGMGALLVDHDMDLVLGVCDRIVVLDFGRVIATGTPAEVAADPRVLAAYLGEAPGVDAADPVREEDVDG